MRYQGQVNYAVQVAEGPNSALDDFKELAKSLRLALAVVMKTDLVHALDPADEDSGAIGDGTRWRWRRGITRQERQRLTPVSEEPTTAQQALDFIIIYRSFTPAEVMQASGLNGFYVWRILPNSCLASMLLRGIEEEVDA